MANTMKVAREDADYRDLFPQVSERMLQQLTDANAFISRLNMLPPSAPQR